jgi:hypothetical protein
MKSFLVSLLLAFICLASSASAFSVRPSVVSTVSGPSSTSLNVFGKRKSQAQKDAEAEKAAKYWQGEWVCKDCGYIYNVVCRSAVGAFVIQKKNLMINPLLFLSNSKNALACTLRSKALASVVLSVRDLVVVTQRRSETVLELLWTVEMRQFLFFLSAVLPLQLLLESGQSIICNFISRKACILCCLNNKCHNVTTKTRILTYGKSLESNLHISYHTLQL